MPEKKEKRTLTLKTSNICIRKDENGNETRVIYGTIPYNTDSVLIQDWWEDYIESIGDSAFKKTISDRAEVKAFVNHDDGKIIGSTGAGTLRLTDTGNGLEFEIDCPDTSFGNDAWKVINRGDCKTLSFGFIPVKYKDETLRDEKGREYTHRTLLEVKLLEISVCVAFPAYPDGSTGARSMFGDEAGITFNQFVDVLKRSQSGELSEEDKKVLLTVSDKITLLTRTAAEDQPPVDTGKSTEEEEAAKLAAEKEAEEKEKRARFAFFAQHVGD